MARGTGEDEAAKETKETKETQGNSGTGGRWSAGTERRRGDETRSRIVYTIRNQTDGAWLHPEGNEGWNSWNGINSLPEVPEKREQQP